MNVTDEFTAMLGDIDRVMTEAERQAFLDRFCTVNPHWRGAHVWDILAELANADAHLEITEAVHDQYAGDPTASVYAWSAVALYWITGETPDVNPVAPEVIRFAERVLERRVRGG